MKKLLPQKAKEKARIRKEGMLNRELARKRDMPKLSSSPVKIADSELLNPKGNTTKVKGKTEHIKADIQDQLSGKQHKQKIGESVLENRVKKAVKDGDKAGLAMLSKSAKKTGQTDILKKAIKNISKKGLKSIPLVGPLAAAGLTALLDSPEAAASELVTDIVPGGVGALGKDSDTIPANAKRFTQSPEEKKKILEDLRKEALLNKIKR